MNIKDFKTKSEWGFTSQEIEELLKNYPDVNMDKFNNALMGITCMMVDDELVIYHHDVELALRCGLENRNMKWYEWD